MEDVVILSVPHTGTTFTESLFKNIGFHDAPLNQRSDGKTVHRDHIHNDSRMIQGLQLVKQGLPLIVPLRHPYLTEESWKRRGKENIDMIHGFRNLMERLVPLDPYWMPVDSEKRAQCLEILNRGLGLEICTQWHPERSIGKTFDITWRDCSPSNEVIELAEEMQPLLEKFYD